MHKKVSDILFKIQIRNLYIPTSSSDFLPFSFHVILIEKYADFFSSNFVLASTKFQ